MTSALLVLLYAIVLAWLMPTILSRLTADGMNARLGLAGWLVAMASAVASAGVALTVLIRATVDGWSRFAEAFCRTVAGGACTTVVYRSFLYEIGVGLAAIAATLTSVVLAWRYGRRLQRAQRITPGPRRGGADNRADRAARTRPFPPVPGTGGARRAGARRVLRPRPTGHGRGD